MDRQRRQPAPSRIEIPLFPGDRIQVAQHLSHAAELGLEHALHVVIAERLRIAGHPTGHLLRDLQRLFITRMDIHVEIAGHDFVDRIKRRPHSFAVPKAIEELDWKRTKITVLQVLLALAEFRDDQIAILLEILIAGARVHQCHRRKVVSARVVAAQFAVRRFPAVQRLYRGR